jgi:hypothetical protein
MDDKWSENSFVLGQFGTSLWWQVVICGVLQWNFIVYLLVVNYLGGRSLLFHLQL